MVEKYKMNFQMSGESSKALLPRITAGDPLVFTLENGETMCIIPYYNRHDLSLYGIISVWKTAERVKKDGGSIMMTESTNNRFKFFNGMCPSYMVGEYDYCEDGITLVDRMDDIRKDGVLHLMGFGHGDTKFRAEIHLSDNDNVELVILRDEDVPEIPWEEGAIRKAD